MNETSNINYPQAVHGPIDFQSIRLQHPLLAYCEQEGIHLHKSSNRWIGKCPLHDEQNGEAFVIQPDQKWQCHGKCSRSGDVVDLERELHGGTVAEAAARLGQGPSIGNIIVSFPMVPLTEPFKLVPTIENPLALPYLLSNQEIADCHRYTRRLLEDCAFMARISEYRQWKEATLRGLALDGYLGRDDDGHICFNSASGCKSRWRQDGEREFRYLFGKCWLWRGELIPYAETVYLCEGETDSITLIDRGIENDGLTVAVGLQGATLNLQPWTFLFTDKHIVIAMDDDEAGWKADAKIELIFAGTVKSISHFWLTKEVA